MGIDLSLVVCCLGVELAVCLLALLVLPLLGSWVYLLSLLLLVSVLAACFRSVSSFPSIDVMPLVACFSLLRQGPIIKFHSWISVSTNPHHSYPVCHSSTAVFTVGPSAITRGMCSMCVSLNAETRNNI